MRHTKVFAQEMTHLLEQNGNSRKKMFTHTHSIMRYINYNGDTKNQ